ncbi:MAG: aminotransferase class IV [Desulfobacterales bacterium]
MPIARHYAAIGDDGIDHCTQAEIIHLPAHAVGVLVGAGQFRNIDVAGEEAHREGYTQVLWLDGVTQEFEEEVGSMNIFFVINDEIVTPELNGSILPGITRDSVIRRNTEKPSSPSATEAWDLFPTVCSTPFRIFSTVFRKIAWVGLSLSADRSCAKPCSSINETIEKCPISS